MSSEFSPDTIINLDQMRQYRPKRAIAKSPTWENNRGILFLFFLNKNENKTEENPAASQGIRFDPHPELTIPVRTLAPRTAKEGEGVEGGEACACLISSPISFPSAPPPLLPSFPQFTNLAPQRRYNHNTFPFHFPLFFFLFFPGGENPCLVFPFWFFVAGPVGELRLRRPRELGDRAFPQAGSPLL